MKSEGGVPYLTAEEMAEMDRAATEDFGLDVAVLMENAGASVATMARRILGGDAAGRRICVLAGKGNNGGDGLVAARHLKNWGAEVFVVLGGSRGELRDPPERQLGTVGKMAIRVAEHTGLFEGAELLVDALLGYGSKGDPREPMAGLIRRANGTNAPILAVDVPSGLDATIGSVGDPCVRATATVTFGLPKTGFLSSEARGYVGDLYLADISLPGALYSRFSGKSDLFRKEPILRIW